MHRGAAALYAAVAVAVGALPATTAHFTASSGATASLSSATLPPPSGFSATQSCAPATPTPIALRGTATALDSSNNTNLTVPVPTHVAGDLLVAHIAWRRAGHLVTPPAGWTLVRRDDVTDGGELAAAVYVRVATASEPAGYSWVTGVGERTAGGMTAWSGVDTAAAVATSDGAQSKTQIDVTAPGVTATRPGSLLLLLAARRYEDVLAPPGTMTERYDITTFGGGQVTRDVNISGSSAIVAAGATGTRTATATIRSTTDVVGQAVVLNPVMIPADPHASLSWTATSDTGATGYTLTRSVGGTVQSTTSVTPRTTVSATQGPLTVGTSYSWSLRTVRGQWTSTAVTASLTPGTCPT